MYMLLFNRFTFLCFSCFYCLCMYLFSLWATVFNKVIVVVIVITEKSVCCVCADTRPLCLLCPALAGLSLQAANLQRYRKELSTWQPDTDSRTWSTRKREGSLRHSCFTVVYYIVMDRTFITTSAQSAGQEDRGLGKMRTWADKWGWSGFHHMRRKLQNYQNVAVTERLHMNS